MSGFHKEVGTILAMDRLSQIYTFTIYQEYETYAGAADTEPQYLPTFKSIETPGGKFATLTQDKTYIEIVETGEVFTVRSIVEYPEGVKYE